MAYATPALVGTIGAVSTGASGAAVTPAWGTSENRTANNLLILQVAVTGSATLPTPPSGWSGANALAGTTCSASIYYKVATGADAAPTIAAITSGIINARLSEYSGMATTNPQSNSGSAAGTTTPQKATNAGADVTSPALMVSAVTMLNSSARTVATFTETYTNGTSISVNNAATSTASHYGFSYANTTAHAAADADSFAFTTTQVTGVAVSLASFLPMFTGVGTASAIAGTFTATAAGAITLLPGAGLATGTFAATAVGAVFVPGVWAIVQQTSNVTSSGNGTVTPTQALSSLSTTMVVAISVDLSSPTEPITSVKDAAGNSFAQLGTVPQATDHGWLELWALATPIGDVGTRPAITVTCSLTNFGIATQFFEVYGILAGTDGAVATNSANASPAVNGAYASTVANELLFFMYGDSGYNSTASLPTGYTASTGNVQSNNLAQLSTWYKNSTGGAESASSTLSAAAHWASLMGAFQLAVKASRGTVAGTFTASATGTWSVPLASGTGAVAGTFAATATGTWVGPTLPGTSFITSVGGSIIPRTWINDFIGMAILVGPAPLVVSALGRYVISGNTQTHVVKLIDGLTGTDIPGGAVTVDTTTVPANTFVYAALASPITLAANTQYFVASFESDSSGDSFLEVYDTLTSTAAAQFTYAYHSGVWTVGSSYNSTAYGPVNFLYSTPSSSAGTYASTVLADGPVFYWRLNELTGTTAADATGNGHTGTYTSGVTLGEPPAVQDGTSMYVVPPNGVSTPDFPAADTYPYSIEVWVNITYVGQWGTLFGKVTNSGWGDGFACYSIGDPNWKFWVGNYTVTGVVFSMPDASGVFTHLVATYDGTTGNVYLNGVLAATAAMTPGASNIAPLWVGEDGNGFGLNGYFDEVAFYSYRLSPTSIAAHYSAGTMVTAYPGTGTAAVTFTASATGSVVFPSTAAMAGSLSASATGAWVPVAHGSGPVLGTFAASATGVVVFSVPGGLTGIFAATATGTSRLPGTGTAASTFAASGTGLVTVAATGAMAGTFTASAATTGSGAVLGAFTATSTGVVVLPSHATLAGVFAGSAAGALAGLGTASGSFTASAQGIVIDPAFGTYVGTFTGLATGVATPVYLGAGTASGIFAASAQGLVTVKGSGSVVGTFTASAAGTLAGSGTVLVFFNAAATGLVTISASGASAGTFSGQATGVIPGLALGTGAIVGAFGASGTALVKIASAAGLTGTFIGNATSVLIGPLAATGPLVAIFTGSASGNSSLPGSSALVSTFIASANGALNKIGSASSIGSFTAMAMGAANTSSSALLIGSFTAVAAGAVNQLGSAMVVGSFSATATALVRSGPEIATLVDDFNTGAFSPAIWVVNPSWFGFSEPVSIVDGQVDITIVDDFSYGGLESVDYYDLTESAVFAQLVSAGDQTTSIDVYPIFMSDANLNVMGWECTTGLLYMMFPGRSSIPMPYDPAIHKWLRVRETGGYLYFDYSIDGTTWVNAYNDIDPPIDSIDLTALRCGFVAGADGSAGPGMTAIFDNVNAVPVTAFAGTGRGAGTFRAHALGVFTTPTTPEWLYIQRSAEYNYSDEVLATTPVAEPVDFNFSDTR